MRMQWQPKNSIPTDGTEIYFNHACIGVRVAKYVGGWLFKCPIRNAFIQSGFGCYLDNYHCIGWMSLDQGARGGI